MANSRGSLFARKNYRYRAKAAFFENCYELEGGLNTLPQKIYFKDQSEILRKNITDAMHELQNRTASPEKIKEFEDKVGRCDTMDCLSWQIKSILKYMESAT